MFVLEIVLLGGTTYSIGEESITELVIDFFDWRRANKIKSWRIRDVGIYDFETGERICYLSKAPFKKDVVIISPSGL